DATLKPNKTPIANPKAVRISPPHYLFSSRAPGEGVCRSCPSSQACSNIGPNSEIRNEFIRGFGKVLSQIRWEEVVAHAAILKRTSNADMSNGFESHRLSLSSAARTAGSAAAVARMIGIEGPALAMSAAAHCVGSMPGIK